MTKQVTCVLFALNSLSNIKRKWIRKGNLSNAGRLQDCLSKCASACGMTLGRSAAPVLNGRPVSLRTKLSSDSFVLTGQPSSPGLKHTRKRTLLQLRHGPVSLGVTQGTWISGHVKLLFRKPFHLTNSRQVPWLDITCEEGPFVSGRRRSAGWGSLWRDNWFGCPFHPSGDRKLSIRLNAMWEKSL